MLLYPHRSAKLAIGLSLAFISTTLSAWDACSDWYSYSFNPYVVQNSTWGRSNAAWGTQCVYASSASNWSADFNWDNGSGNNLYSVKAWPAIYRGLWDSNGQTVNTGSNSHLPKEYFNLGNITGSVTWNYQTGDRPRHNASYDLWLDRSQTGESGGNSRIEVMVWQGKYGSNVGPLGTLKTSNFSISGSTYNVYVSQGQVSWNVVSYVRTSNTSSHANLNLKNFLTNAASRVGANPNNYWLQSLDWGFEIYGGKGNIKVTNYSVGNL